MRPKLLLKAIGLIADRTFDFCTGLDFQPDKRVEDHRTPRVRKGRRHDYEGTRLLPCRAAMKMLRELQSGPSVFMDCGSGKGKVLCLAAEAGFEKIRGVEIDSSLAKVSKKNWDRFKNHRIHDSELQLYISDMGRYAFMGDENVFFFFNPFPSMVLREVLANLGNSLVVAPRRVYLCFIHMSDEYRLELKQCSQTELVREDNFWGCCFTTWTFQKDS